MPGFVPGAGGDVSSGQYGRYRGPVREISEGVGPVTETLEQRSAPASDALAMEAVPVEPAEQRS